MSVVGADEVGAESDGGGHPAASGLPVAGQPQLLDGTDVVAVALAGEGFVVEVGGGGAHRTEREGVALGVAAAGGVDIVGELDTDRHGEIKVRK